MGHHYRADKRIATAFFLNLIFTIVEIIGGILTSSMAILSDALHDLGDSISLGLAWYFQKKSSQGRSNIFSYGYKRFSLLGAMISAIVLMTGSVLILIRVIPTLADPQQVNSLGMIALAVLGVIFNGLAFLRMKGGVDLNEKMVTWHLLEDVLGWAAVLLGACAIYLFDLPVLDPILSIMITVFVMYQVIKNTFKSLRIFLQGTPENIQVQLIEDKIQSIKGVMNTHDCHVWTLDGQFNVLTMHVVLDDSCPPSTHVDLKQQIRKELSSMNINHSTVEIEYENEECALVDC